MIKLSWRDVLDCKGWTGTIDLMYKRAIFSEYKYFSFNGIIYEILKDVKINYKEITKIKNVY